MSLALGKEGFGLAVLPMDLLVLILADYLGGGGKDMSSMDIACAPSVRKDFLGALSNHALGLSVMSLREETLTWVRARGAHLRELQMAWSQLPLFTALEPMLSTVKDLVLEKDSHNDDLSNILFKQLLTSCPKLEAIKLTRAQYMSTIQVMELITAHCPVLQLKTITCIDLLVTAFYGRQCVRKIASVFQSTLEELTVPYFYLTNAELQALQVCSKLKALTCILQVANMDCLRSFLKSMPHLKQLMIQDFIIVLTEETLAEAADCFSGLHFLVILEFSSFRVREKLSKVFAILIKACPNLRMLQVGDISYRLYKNARDESSFGCSLIVNATTDTDTVQLLVEACPFPVVEIRKVE